MISVDDSKELIPENNLQELWQQNGRVNALVAWLRSKDTPDSSGLVYVKDILAMLGK